MSAEPAQPSARAVERLATGVGEDVADLRTQLHRALTRADRLEAAGRQDLAVVVLQEQRDALVDVHRRLEARLADAAVEREAERVVDVAAVERQAELVVDAAAVGDRVTASRGDVAGSSDDGMGLRLVAAAAAAVLGIALLLSPGAGTVGVTIAGSDAAGDAVDAQRHGGDPAVDPGASSDAAAARSPDASAPPAGLADRTSDAVRPADLWAWSIPEAYVLAPAPDEEADDADDDGTDTDLGGVTEPLQPPDPTLEPPAPEEPVLPVSEGDDDRDSGDGGEAADDGESGLLGR